MKRLSVFASLLFVCASAFAQTQDKPVTISGLAFGDYYYVVSHHDPNVDGKNGFWLRRGYLTFDKTLSDEFAARLRFEINSPGDFRTNANMEPFVKDAWVRYRRSPKLDIVAGIQQTPAFDAVERIWGYRPVERTPVDLHRLAAARDFGIAFVGAIDDAKTIRYNVQFGNGSGTGNETNREKKVAASLAWLPAKETYFEVYADRENRPGEDDRSIVQAFAAYQRQGMRAGAQFTHQSREPHDVDLASVFGVVDIRPNLSLLARVDRLFDPSPEGNAIAYLPFNTTSESTLFIAGADWRLHKNVSLIPNVEVVQYDDDVDTTVLPRLTLSITF